MNRILRRVVFFILVIMSFSVIAGRDDDPMAGKEAPVCLIDFRIDFAVGRTESELDNPGICRYAVNREAFLGLLSRRPDSEYYENRDVRVKVTFSGDVIYFIDRNGVVRLGSKKFLIDKQKFIRLIRKVS